MPLTGSRITALEVLAPSSLAGSAAGAGGGIGAAGAGPAAGAGGVETPAGVDWIGAADMAPLIAGAADMAPASP